MFYLKTGRVKSNTRLGSRPLQVQLQMYAGKAPRISCSPIMTRGENYLIMCGRGSYLGWIGFWFNEPLKRSGRLYKIQKGRSKNILHIHSHMAVKDYTADLIHEREWVLERDILYVRLPSFAREQRKWYDRVPNVRDNPWTARDQIRELHGLWGSEGEQDDVHGDERPTSTRDDSGG